MPLRPAAIAGAATQTGGYDALGINWTHIRYDDPLKRGFEYVPFANYDIYGPIRELF